MDGFRENLPSFPPDNDIVAFMQTELLRNDACLALGKVGVGAKFSEKP